MKKSFFALLGAVTGLANGLFGSGGGMIAVPMLKHSGIEQKKSQATAMAITLPLSIISAFIYIQNEHIELTSAMKFIPLGLVGSIFGSILLKKIDNRILKKIFGALLIFSGVRMLFI